MNIRTIAELCGVSTSTVSRILNNKSDVSAETRKKVINKMNEIGFRPMITAGKHETIGVVMPEVSNTEFIGELINGITNTAFSLGRNLTLIPYNAVKDASDMTHYCRVNGLKGMLVINPPIQSKLPEHLLNDKIPHVIIASSYRDSDISWVDVDNVAGSKEAVNHLIELGHKNIALIHHQPIGLCDQDRIAGYKAALIEHGLEVEPRLQCEVGGNGMDLTDAIQTLLRSPLPPTGIYCTSYRKTLQVLDTLQRKGIKVPDDISVVGFGDYDVFPLTKPPMTTVFQPVYEMGKRAAEVFEEISSMAEYQKIQVSLPVRLIVRDSTSETSAHSL